MADEDAIEWGDIADVARPRLLAAIDRPGLLTAAQRSVVRAFLSGMRPVDIARSRGCSKPTVTIMLNRTRRNLAAALVPGGFSMSTRRGASRAVQVAFPQHREDDM